MNLNNKEFLVENLVIDDEYGVIESNATVEDAAKKMKSLGVPDLVVEDAESKKVLGVIADFDIVQKVVAEGSDPKTASVLTAMYTIEPVRLKTTVKEAFDRMQALQVNVVPVVEKDKLIGVSTIQDCWSYIPDKTVDSVGLIPITNTRIAEFWFASTCAILGFVIGILLPLIGVYGFFHGNQANLLSFFGFAEIRGGIINFELFEARGIDFLVPFASLIARNGVIWVFLIINGFIILILGILALFSLIYASFSDARAIRTGLLVRKIIPFLLIVFMILEWILYAIAFGSAVPAVSVTVDALGLTMSILAMLLFLGAVYRDYVFRSKTIPTTEVKS